MENKVVLGLSGGVDSAVAARLLQRNGYKVIGLWLDFGCGFPKDAQINAEQLGIEFRTADVSALHKDIVRMPFVQAYLTGKTPNPCVVCNPGVKFPALISEANRLGAEFIATGHYARVDCLNGRFRLLEALSDNDQSYMMYRLPQPVLSRLLLPLGTYPKPEIRRIAAEENLSVAAVKDSMDICFVPGGDYGTYMESEGYLAPAGNFVDTYGNILGRHEGIHRYTVGQRRGLGISAASRLYVSEIRPDKAEVVLSDGSDMHICELVITVLNWVSIEPADKPFRAEVKVRHSKIKYPAEVVPVSGGARIVFDSPICRPSVGQSAVAYVDGAVICGGFISHYYRRVG